MTTTGRDSPSALNMLSETKIFIDDTPALTPIELRARCRRIKREHDLGLVVVDYLQLMQVPGTKENRATEISEISRSLKALAKSYTFRWSLFRSSIAVSSKDRTNARSCRTCERVALSNRTPM